MLTTDNQIHTEPAGSSDVSVRDILDILFRRRWLILIVLLLSVAAATDLMLRPRKYTADGTIRIQPGTASMYRTSPLSILSGEATDQIASEAAILQSRTLYLQVAKELNLVNDPAFWGRSTMKPQSLDDPKVREKLVRQMRKSIEVGHNPNEIIRISCTTISPELSSKIVNTLINDYISYLFQMRYGSTKRASEWLIGQLNDLKQQIEGDQTEIINLQKRLGVIGLNEQTADYLQIQSLDSMTKATSEATVERILAEAKLRYLEESNPNLIEGEANLLAMGSPNPTQNGLLQNLRNARAEAASNYARLLAQFGPQYPEVRDQKAQLDEIDREVKTEQERILNQAKLTFDAASANEKMDQDALKRTTGEAFKSGGDMVRYVLLLHDYQAHRGLYEELVQRLREAGITAGLEAGEIDIVDLADLPAIPNPPGPILLLAGSLFAGLIMGCFLAQVADALDTRVIDAEQAGRILNLPLLGMVPHANWGKQKSGAPASSLDVVAPGLRYTEAIQGLRSSILLATPGRPPKTILVTSAAPAEGKSTTARNMAIVFARHGARVLLVDCDLRIGSQATSFGVASAKGVTSILTGHTSLGESLEQVPAIENLSVLTSGPRAPDPAVLIASEQMARLVRTTAENFDFVILDSAPILGLSDTINLGQMTEAAILVVREGQSNRKAIREAVARMRSARLPVLGFVLNDIDLRAHAYSYGYGAGYGKYDGYYRDTSKEGQ